MLFGIFIITRGGVVLWKNEFEPINGDPVSGLIREVLMEEKRGESRATVNGYNFSWKFSNHCGLIYIVCFQGILRSSVLDEILDGISISFETRYIKRKNSIDKLIGSAVDFDDVVTKVIEVCFSGETPTKPSNDVLPTSSVNDETEIKSSPSLQPEVPGGRANRRAFPRPFQKKTIASKMSGQVENPLNVSTGSNSGSKVARDWSELGILTNKKKNLSEADIEKLNMRKGNEEIVDEEEVRRRARIFHGIDDLTYLKGNQAADESDSEDEVEESSTVLGLFNSLKNYLPAFLRKRLGGVYLTDEEMNRILDDFEKKLISKNVARDVAVSITSSVRTSLRGVTTDQFQSVYSAVRGALSDAVRRILTPKKSVDVLRMAIAAKSKGHPFSICFLGTNGVGKSTNLAKIAFHLQHKGGLKVLIAACDTFRSGAVEQLRTHAKNLDCELFERGYGKDAAEIAAEALTYAKQHQFDVVLIDTAGRMQDNEPLMRALGKLVSVNKPDLVLFVGEALVGNDAIDQLVKFNAALRDLCNPSRQVDGMILSKFDTVDDKVGAALTMVATTGQPVVFVGTGQKYPHLRKLHVAQVVDALLS